MMINCQQFLQFVSLLLFLLMATPAFGIKNNKTNYVNESSVKYNNIIVRQRISSNYNKDIDNLRGILNFPLELTIKIKQGDTISGIISKIYKIGLSNAPEAYELINEFVTKKNHIKKIINVGQKIIIPDIPPLAKTKPNPFNQFNATPKLSIPKQIIDENSAATLPSTLTPKEIKTTNNMRKGAPDVILVRAIPQDIAQNIVTAKHDELDIVSAPISVQLASSEPVDQFYSFISEQDYDTISKVLMKRQYKHPVLFIFDDSWPDETSYKSSIAFLCDAINMIRRRYKMGSSNISQIMKDVSFTDATNVNSTKPHSLQIKDSLLPLQSLDSKENYIRIVYIPMFLVQRGAYEILRELIEIDLIAKHLRNELGKYDVPYDITERYKELSSQILSEPRSHTNKDINNTDICIINAVLEFLHLYSQAANEPFFLNMSWTTPNNVFEPNFPADAYGLMLAAAGNNGDKLTTTIYDTKSQFAYRSLNPGDVLAVMNVNSEGEPVCNSSLLITDNDIMGLSFPGSTSKTNCGGTSFSTPRVAWLLALREAITPSDKANLWKFKLRSFIRSLHDPEAQSYNRIKLSIQKLFAN